MKEETKMLSKFLGKKSSTIKTELGEPDLINFNIPYKTYIYYKKNLLIKCTREFFINPKTDLIEKFNFSETFEVKKASVNCPCSITVLNNSSVNGVGT